MSTAVTTACTSLGSAYDDATSMSNSRFVWRGSTWRTQDSTRTAWSSSRSSSVWIAPKSTSGAGIAERKNRRSGLPLEQRVCSRPRGWASRRKLTDNKCQPKYKQSAQRDIIFAKREGLILPQKVPNIQKWIKNFITVFSVFSVNPFITSSINLSRLK